MVDIDENRLEVARKLGATNLVNSGDGDAPAQIRALTYNRGVDVAMEAVGIPETFDICQQIVAAGGVIAHIGVHGTPVSLDLDKLWAHNITLTTRLADTVAMPLLLKTVMAGKVEPKQLVTHRFALDDILDDIMAAYETFGQAAQERALKVILNNS